MIILRDDNERFIPDYYAVLELYIIFTQGLNEIGTTQQTLINFAKSLLQKYLVNDGALQNKDENFRAKNDTKNQFGDVINSNIRIERYIHFRLF